LERSQRYRRNKRKTRIIKEIIEKNRKPDHTPFSCLRPARERPLRALVDSPNLSRRWCFFEEEGVGRSDEGKKQLNWVQAGDHRGEPRRVLSSSWRMLDSSSRKKKINPASPSWEGKGCLGGELVRMSRKSPPARRRGGGGGGGGGGGWGGTKSSEFPENVPITSFEKEKKKGLVSFCHGKRPCFSRLI